QWILDLLHRTPTPIVHTFGDMDGLVSVWTAAARAGCAVAHLATSSPRDQIGAHGDKLARRSWSLDRLRARQASGHVQALIGTSPIAISRPLEAGWFPKAKFTMVALPPISMVGSREEPAQTRNVETPALGFYLRDGVRGSLRFLLDAIKLTGN